MDDTVDNVRHLPAPSPVAAAPRSTGSPAEVVDEAWRDLREFQVRLTQLHDTAVAVTDPAGRATSSGTGVVLDVPTVLGDLHDGIDQADACLDSVVRGVGAVAGTASGPRTASAAMRRDFDALTSRVRRATACGGDPAALRTAAGMWASGVGLPAVATLLTGLADAITTFWVDITVACAALTRALFAAAVAATSPLGGPDAIGSAAAALAAFGVATGTAERSLTTVTAAVATALEGARTGKTGSAPRS